MTFLQNLDRLLELIEQIAAYEMGDPNVTKGMYIVDLRTASDLAEAFQMDYYRAQCQDKLLRPENV